MSKKQSRDRVHIASDVTLRLIAARQLLQDGWCQHQPREGGSYCILGALFRDVADLSVAGKARKIVYAVLPFGVWIHKWNDVKGRTQEEVLHLMDKAIARSMDRS